VQELSVLSNRRKIVLLHSITIRGLEAPGFQPWGGKAACVAEHPLAGSRFEWERLNPTGFPGKVSLDKVRQRYFLLSTSSNPVQMFNPGVLEQRPGSRSRR